LSFYNVAAYLTDQEKLSIIYYGATPPFLAPGTTIPIAIDVDTSGVVLHISLICYQQLHDDTLEAIVQSQPPQFNARVPAMP
jgi:hypothetical protein